jgi:hypothetical protein
MKTSLLFAACCLLAPIHARAAVWQWSSPVESVVSSETNDHPRAFLWIPPGCKRLRGVVVGQHNMEEEMIFEHPTFRETLTDLDFAVIWITPAIDLFFRFDKGAGEDFNRMFAALAERSGYQELTRVPVVPLGHSAAASYPWNFGAWAPERTLAAISVSGQWPYYKDQNTPDWGNRNVDGVPGLVTMGEYEAAYDRAGTGLRDRAAHPMTPLSMLAEPAGEHFAATDAKISFISLYLRTAAKHRLPEDWPVTESPKLKPIDPTRTGWLVDRGRTDGKPTAPAAPVGGYTGDPKEAFWVFDEAFAKATESFGAMYAGKKPQLLGYVQKDGIVPQVKQHVRVKLKFEPEGDGLTFKLKGTFLDTVPEDWRGLKTGDPIGHAKDASQITIQRICGPVEATGPDTYAIRFYRMGMTNQKRSNSICFIARHPGDDEYRPMMLESEMKFPLENKQGADQEITFQAPETLKYGTKTLPLAATSSAGRKVHFYVREGPAEITGDQLKFEAVPPRAKFPVNLTIVAWQWGSSIDPKVKTAKPVERTIRIVR